MVLTLVGVQSGRGLSRQSPDGGGAAVGEVLVCHFVLKCFLKSESFVFLVWIYRPPLVSLTDSLKKTLTEHLIWAWHWASRSLARGICIHSWVGGIVRPTREVRKIGQPSPQIETLSP